MSTEAPTILLWLFVINLGIAFGAGLYEHRVVTPNWITHDATGSHWNAEMARRDDTGLRFWAYVTTGPLTLLTLANLFMVWKTSGPERGWWLIAALVVLGNRILTFSYFHPDDGRVDERHRFTSVGCHGKTMDESELSAACPRARWMAGRAQGVLVAIGGARLTRVRMISRDRGRSFRISH